MAARKNYTVAYEGGLNLRAKPSKDSNVLAVLAFGAKVTVDPTVETPDEWLAVKDGGYVMSAYLK